MYALSMNKPEAATFRDRWESLISF